MGYDDDLVTGFAGDTAYRLGKSRAQVRIAYPHHLAAAPSRVSGPVEGVPGHLVTAKGSLNVNQRSLAGPIDFVGAVPYRGIRVDAVHEEDGCRTVSDLRLCHSCAVVAVDGRW